MISFRIGAAYTHGNDHCTPLPTRPAPCDIVLNATRFNGTIITCFSSRESGVIISILCKLASPGLGVVAGVFRFYKIQNRKRVSFHIYFELPPRKPSGIDVGAGGCDSELTNCLMLSIHELRTDTCSKPKYARVCCMQRVCKANEESIHGNSLCEIDVNCAIAYTHTQQINWPRINVGPIGLSRNSVHTSFEYDKRIRLSSNRRKHHCYGCCLSSSIRSRLTLKHFVVSPKNAIANETRCDTRKK